MHLCHDKKRRSELGLELFEVKTLVNKETKVLIVFFVLGLLEQELVEVVHYRLLRQVGSVLLDNLVDLLGLVEVLQGLLVLDLVFLVVGATSVGDDDGNVVVQVLDGVQVAKLEGVGKTVHQLKALL